MSKKVTKLNLEKSMKSIHSLFRKFVLAYFQIHYEPLTDNERRKQIKSLIKTFINFMDIEISYYEAGYDSNVKKINS